MKLVYSEKYGAALNLETIRHAFVSDAPFELTVYYHGVVEPDTFLSELGKRFWTQIKACGTNCDYRGDQQ